MITPNIARNAGQNKFMKLRSCSSHVASAHGRLGGILNNATA